MTDVRDILSIALNQREVIASTNGEWFRYIRRNWLGAYVIIRPGNAGDMWRALATWGNEDELQSDSPGGLLELIRRHYGPETEGYTNMLMHRLGRKYS